VLHVLYAGSPESSARTLDLLYENAASSGYEITGVLTNPPSSQGRHKELVPTPVARLAQEKSLRVFMPEHLDGALREQITAVNPDILVCFAYGHIFGPKFLSLFRFGGINLHPSLLPKYRGCTPVNAAILNMDCETGITIQKIVQGMDEGDILAQEIVHLNGLETAGSLLLYSAEHGAGFIRSVLETVVKTGKLPEETPQKGIPSYTQIITKENGRIDWTHTAAEIDAQIRAYTPEPGCWTTEKNVPLRILTAHPAGSSTTDALPGTVVSFDRKQGVLIQTGGGMLAVTMLQRQAKKAMDAVSFMNGVRDFVGTVLK
jgi:methionyl-tRNA formyltransferase